MRYLFIVLYLVIVTTIFPATLIINQDGTGDYTTISAGITAAQNGDTLLVYPGIYQERINYQGKNITVTSLYDGDQHGVSYIANTVIDGNHEGTVVIFNSGENRNAVLNGFTIRNGEGEFHHNPSRSWAGGIYITDSSPVISNCHIRNNRAYVGSGIRLFQTGNPLLKGNRISYNHSISYGAVVASGGQNNLEFCQINLNSIYLNYGGDVCDLFFGGYDQSSVVIDTFTVLNPDRYFYRTSQHVPDNLTLTVNHGKITPLAADLFVSPDGCDTNSGLSFAEPLQTIAMAMIKILPDSLQQRTVHVAEGIYSRSLNNQRFPIQLRSYIDITGADSDNTILNMETETLAFYHFTPVISGVFTDNCGNFTVSNFTLINGGNPLFDQTPGAIYIYYTNRPISFQNLVMRDGDSRRYGQVMIHHTSEISLKNIHIYDSRGGDAMWINNDWGQYLNVYAENIRIRNNIPGPFHPNYTGGYGGGLSIRSGSTVVETTVNATIVNLEVTDCIVDNVLPPWQGSPWTNFNVSGPLGEARIINATIGNNTTGTPYGGGIRFSGSLDFELINSIVYGNTPHNLSLMNVHPLPGNVYISYSLIAGEEDNVFYYQNPNTYLHWGEGNIDTDPLWMGVENPEFPYMLSENSPARNAGTLDIPGFEFPEYDLAGNLRIYGNSIDLGAYEWSPVGIGNQEELLPVLSDHDYKLFNYPNPVVGLQGLGRGSGTATTFSFVMPHQGEAKIDIYNLKGQFVRRVFDAYVQPGEYNVTWNGRDEQERVVATGFYLYRLQVNGVTVATGRCMFVK